MKTGLVTMYLPLSIAAHYGPRFNCTINKAVCLNHINVESRSVELRFLVHLQSKTCTLARQRLIGRKFIAHISSIFSSIFRSKVGMPYDILLGRAVKIGQFWCTFFW